MKKILALLTILTLTVVSCKKTETKSDVTTEVTDTTTVVVDSVEVDTTKVVGEVK